MSGVCFSILRVDFHILEYGRKRGISGDSEDHSTLPHLMAWLGYSLIYKFKTNFFQMTAIKILYDHSKHLKLISIQLENQSLTLIQV